MVGRMHLHYQIYISDRLNKPSLSYLPALQERKRAPRRFEETKKFHNTLEGSKKKPDAAVTEGAVSGTGGLTTIADEVAANIAALNSRSPKMGMRGGGPKKAGRKPTAKE